MGTKVITPRNTGSPDFMLILVTLILLSLGITMVFSSSVGYLLGSVGNKDVFKFFRAQITWAGFGVAAMILFTHVNHKIYKRFASLIMLTGIAALVLVLIPGVGLIQKGSARWLDLGFVTVQPSEAVKLALSIFLAAILSNKGLKTFGDLFLPLGVMGVCALLVVKQPDLGTSMVIVSTAIGILFIAGMRLRYFIGLLGVGSLLVYEVISSKPYMMDRLQVWFDPWSHVQREGYQIVNALMALGSGGLFGAGLGRGMQKFGHVPENYTDMIFAIIGEELGLVGTAATIILFALFVWRGLSIAMDCKEAFSRYLAVGITCMIGLQAMINLGVVTGLLPVTGVTLPFISYGGSSLVLNLTGVGVLLNISRYARQDIHKPKLEGTANLSAR